MKKPNLVGNVIASLEDYLNLPCLNKSPKIIEILNQNKNKEFILVVNDLGISSLFDSQSNLLMEA